MADKAIARILPRMFINEDPRLNQYLAAIYARGFSLRTIADVALVSYETIRLRLNKAAEEQARGYIADLSDLPSVTDIPKVDRHKAPYFMSEDVKAMLRTANANAQKYRKGQDATFPRAFNSLVLELVGQGIPFAAIAEACGQGDSHLRRRLARWDVYPTRRPNRNVRKLDAIRKADAEEAAAARAAETKLAVKNRKCKWPDCPSYSGGECIHQ